MDWCFAIDSQLAFQRQGITSGEADAGERVGITDQGPLREQGGRRDFGPQTQDSEKVRILREDYQCVLMVAVGTWRPRCSRWRMDGGLLLWRIR